MSCQEMVPVAVSRPQSHRATVFKTVMYTFHHTGIKWLALGDLNSRPSDYESLALTN